MPADIPPEFAWLGGLITNTTTALQQDMEVHFKRNSKKVKQVKREVTDLKTKVSSNETAIRAAKTSHDNFAAQYYRDKVASDLELKLLRQELTDIQYGRLPDRHGWMTRLDA